MSLIDRYIGKTPTEYCDKCGAEGGGDFYGVFLCDECFRKANYPATVAEYAMTFPGSWHEFLIENVLDCGDLTISEITSRAIEYFGKDYAEWFKEEFTK